jgi:hypothetical protein
MHSGFWARKRQHVAVYAPKSLVVLVAAVVLAACTSPKASPMPPPVSVPATTSTTVPDYSAIGLKSVPGRTTTTIAVQPGQATISGTVVGPGGPVAEALVRAERLVGDGAGSMDVVTAADGTFALAGVLGGRYRVRAWKAAPDNLALVDPQVFFLEGKESKVVNLPLHQYQGAAVTSDIAPNPPVIGQPANIVVQVVNRAVDTTGIVRSEPVANVRVELFGPGDWKIRSTNPVIADASGKAQFTAECRRAGQQPLSVVVGDSATFPLTVPPCAVPVDPSAPGDTTTTAAPPASTTSTTAARTTTTAAR